eukprot:356034-Chlamydomonas_euryale.AAC.13
MDLHTTNEEPPSPTSTQAATSLRSAAPSAGSFPWWCRIQPTPTHRCAPAAAPTASAAARASCHALSCPTTRRPGSASARACATRCSTHLSAPASRPSRSTWARSWRRACSAATTWRRRPTTPRTFASAGMTCAAWRSGPST